MAKLSDFITAMATLKANFKTKFTEKGIDVTSTPFTDYYTKIDEVGGNKLFPTSTGWTFSKSGTATGSISDDKIYLNNPWDNTASTAYAKKTIDVTNVDVIMAKYTATRSNENYNNGTIKLSAGGKTGPVGNSTGNVIFLDVSSLTGSVELTITAYSDGIATSYEWDVTFVKAY